MGSCRLHDPNLQTPWLPVQQQVVLGEIGNRLVMVGLLLKALSKPTTPTAARQACGGGARTE